VYAGGTELLLVLRAGVAQARHLVDIKRIPGLTSIWTSARDGAVRIGGSVPHARVALSPEVAEWAPALVEAERDVGNVRVRSTGTLGGNLCFAEPHGDPGTALLAYGATVRLEGRRGARDVALEDFLLGALETAREPDEILTHVELPARRRHGAAYLRFASAERPTAGVAALVDVEDGRLRDVRLAVGGIEQRPVRLRETEAAAEETIVPDAAAERFDAVGAAAGREVEPVSDQYGPADYKRALVATLVSRVLRRACDRAADPPGAGR
jgi:aerobic carbon-monoxide dehydrogenase medium subunit